MRFDVLMCISQLIRVCVCVCVCVCLCVCVCVCVMCVSDSSTAHAWERGGWDGCTAAQVPAWSQHGSISCSDESDRRDSLSADGPEFVWAISSSSSGPECGRGSVHTHHSVHTHQSLDGLRRTPTRASSPSCGVSSSEPQSPAKLTAGKTRPAKLATTASLRGASIVWHRSGPEL
jgi:hypothetical protein